MIYAGLLGCCFVWWEYISTGRWWATLMRHHLLARPPLALAPGMCMAAFATVLVTLGSSPLGTTSGQARTIGAAIALTPVAVAAHERGHTAARAQETSRWWLHRHSCTDEGWAGQCLMFREILTSATSPSRARGTASGCTCYGMDPASCLLSLYRHAPFLTAHAPVGYLSNLAASHHHLTNPQGRVCTRPPGSCKHGLAGNSLRSLAARFTRKPTAVHKVAV